MFLLASWPTPSSRLDQMSLVTRTNAHSFSARHTALRHLFALLLFISKMWNVERDESSETSSDRDYCTNASNTSCPEKLAPQCELLHAATWFTKYTRVFYFHISVMSLNSNFLFIFGILYFIFQLFYNTMLIFYLY